MSVASDTVPVLIDVLPTLVATRGAEYLVDMANSKLLPDDVLQTCIGRAPPQEKQRNWSEKLHIVPQQRFRFGAPVS